MFHIDNEGTIEWSERQLSIEGQYNFNEQQGLRYFVEHRGWNKQRLTEIWNGFAGAPPFQDLKELKCFRNSGYAVERIWEAIQRLAPNVEKPPFDVDAPSNGTNREEPVEIDDNGTVTPAQPKGTMKQTKKRGLAAKVAATLSDKPKKQAKKATGRPKAQSKAARAAIKKRWALPAPVPARASGLDRAAVEATASTPTAREGTKKAQVIAMVSRKQGASVDELMELLGTQHRHSVRGLLSTLASKGFAIVTEKDEKRGHVYRAA